MANQYGMVVFDANLELTASNTLAATKSYDDILDLGAGLVDGFIVFDVDSVEVASGDEKYVLALEGSSASAMDSGSVTLAKKDFGNLTAPMDAALSTAGRYLLPFRNEEGGSLFRYVRLHATVSGTIATGMVFSAFLAKR